ncbi:acetate--CoA ligase family protein [Chloroflexota bacterium]
MSCVTEEVRFEEDGGHPPLEYIFHPQSIAVVGASPNPRKRGHEYMKWLLDYGYRGKLYPVNRRSGDVLGLRAYPSLADIPGPVDHVISCIPAYQVSQLIQECVAKGVKVIQLHTAGFSETGDEAKAKLELEAVNIARNAGIRVIGPNCMGLHYPRMSLAFGANSSQPHWKESGPVGYFSQSGGNASELLNRASIRGIRFSKVISYGNACDLNEGDFLEYFSQDPETEIICAYLEGVRDGRRFVAALKQATSLKPVIILKGGRTEAGTRAVSSHTGSLAGSNQLWDALCRQVGAIRVYDLEEMADLVLAFLFLTPPQGRRVGVIGMGGGASVQSADDCTVEGLHVPPFPDDVRQELRRFTPEAGTSIRNPVEGQMVRSPDLREIIRIVEDYQDVDLLMFNINVDFSSGKLGQGTEFSGVIDTLIGAKEASSKPWAVVLRSAGARESLDAIEEGQSRCWEAGIPVYYTMAHAARAISTFIHYHEMRA